MKLTPRPDVEIEDRRDEPPPTDMQRARALLAGLLQQRQAGPPKPYGLLAAQAGYYDIGRTPLIEMGIHEAVPMPKPRPKPKRADKDSD